MFAELWELLRSGAIRRHQDRENMKCEAIRVSLVVKIFFDHNILEIEGRQQLSVWFSEEEMKCEISVWSA